MMQCKHDIYVNHYFDISKIRKCWLKRKNISQSSNKGNYNSPTIIKYKSMIRNVPNDEMFLHNEINSHNTTVNNNGLVIVNDIKIPNELKIEELLPEERVSYSSYSVIYDNIYNDIKNKNEISKYVIVLLLEMSHVINNTTGKTIVISRLLEQTKKFNFFF